MNEYQAFLALNASTLFWRDLGLVMLGSFLTALLLFLKNFWLTPWRDAYFCLLGFLIPFWWFLWFWFLDEWFLSLAIVSGYKINYNLINNIQININIQISKVHCFLSIHVRLQYLLIIIWNPSSEYYQSLVRYLSHSSIHCENKRLSGCKMFHSFPKI